MSRPLQAHHWLTVGVLLLAVVIVIALVRRERPDAVGAPFGVERVDAAAARRDGAMTVADASADGPRAAPPQLARINVEVRDETGRPVAGARLALVDPSGAPLGEAPPAAAHRLEPMGELGVLRGPIPYPPLDGPLESGAASSLQSDTAGRFSFALREAGRGSVVAHHAALGAGRSAEVSWSPGHDAQAVILLRRGLPARGRVVDEQGGVGDAEVWRGELMITLADATGRFELAGLEVPAEVEVRARGHLPARGTLVPGGEEVEIRMALARGRVTGVVLDERGFAVAGASLELSGSGGARLRTLSDRRGEFILEGVPGGRLGLRAAATGYPVWSSDQVAAGDDVRVALVPGGGVAGELRDEVTGELPVGAEIVIEDAQGERQRGRFLDRRGRFEVGPLSAGLARLQAEAAGYLPAKLTLMVPPGERPGEMTARDLRITLVLGGSVVGTVTDRYGQPQANVEVAGGDLTTRTDSAGRYRLTPLASGVITVSAQAASGVVTVAAGREAQLDLRFP